MGEAPAEEVPTLGSMGVCADVEPDGRVFRVRGDCRSRASEFDIWVPIIIFVNGFVGFSCQDVRPVVAGGSGWSLRVIGALGKGLSRWA